MSGPSFTTSVCARTIRSRTSQRSLATLADVVKFYVAGGGSAAAGTTKDPLLVPLTLSDAEQADLVEFLKTLSGAAVPAALQIDTSGQ